MLTVRGMGAVLKITLYKKIRDDRTLSASSYGMPKKSPVGGKCCWHSWRTGLMFPASITALPCDPGDFHGTQYFNPGIPGMYQLNTRPSLVQQP